MAERTSNSEQDRKLWQAKFLAERPPLIRFTADAKVVLCKSRNTLNHIEFMMSLMEAHPIFPFENCTFGSDVLDFRRGVAYEVILRQLAHTRSLVVNANVRNRPGIGTALRCMLEMHAFTVYLHHDNRLGDARLLEKLYQGRAFTKGGWYDFEKVWFEEYGDAIPPETKQVFESWLNLPRVGTITKQSHDADKGAAYLYSVYSEFVHPVFGRPREESEMKQPEEMSAFGTSAFYKSLLECGEPVVLLDRDLQAASLCLELFWGKALEIDPFFDDRYKSAIVQTLAEQGFAPNRVVENAESARPQ